MKHIKAICLRSLALVFLVVTPVVYAMAQDKGTMQGMTHDNGPVPVKRSESRFYSGAV